MFTCKLLKGPGRRKQSERKKKGVDGKEKKFYQERWRDRDTERQIFSKLGEYQPDGRL